MERKENPRAVSEDYADLIVYYLNNPKILNQYGDAAVQYINEAFAIVHIPIAEMTKEAVRTFSYNAIPKLYGLTSEESLGISGVTKLRSIQKFNLRGNGVIIGIIDTGIDYTNPVFIKQDGTTKIISIWDQTLTTGAAPVGAEFGTEYNSEQINQALKLENPYELVPSKDKIGHGTMLAGVAAGNEVPQYGFSGVVPESDLVIVKLRQAKKYLRDFFIVPNDIPCYQENHIMWGVQYCTQIARNLNRPIVILTGMGTSQGSHSGYEPLPVLTSIIGDFPDTVVVLPAGNEGNLKRHFHGSINDSTDYATVELHVGNEDKGFSMELWGNAYGTYSIDILSPSGEFISNLPISIQLNREISFIFEQTIIYLDAQLTQTPTGEPLILMRFSNVTSGIWRFNVYDQSGLPGDFDIWLPMGNMITIDTYFVVADNDITLLASGAAVVPIVMTAYDPKNNTLYLNAGRGYSRDNTIKPELAAPGVNYIAPNLNQKFSLYTGSSVAAAHTAGIAAMILEWGVIRKNDFALDSIKVKNYLIRGSVKLPELTYPNRDWGYGIINIFQVYDIFKLRL
ncbi:S8 family peptidase [Anaeromicropila populeti]|uniref:Subtilase family protein n=1 Tax=Anaeromicropila populeti TaxID=37658 RepID=A0A1I6IN76_9FIRM|nr:S8 family peptidase [Anaeromicropila populeti]SFR68193.1 Subtilase family protein [Anaeromicropila populeti]